MKADIREAFDKEMKAAKVAYSIGETDTALLHLERAHILGQRYFLPHWRSHWWMLKVGRQRQDREEVSGQIVRLIAVIPGFLFGWVPKGNTGGANVSAVKPMSAPDDLKPLLADYNVWRDVVMRMIFWVAVISAILFAFAD